jgi:hypothetical protein
VGTTLVVLVQHLLARFSIDENGTTVYEADGDVAYNVCFRYAKLAKVVEDRAGPLAAIVFQRVALLGHTTPAALEKSFGFTTATENGTGVGKNGVKPNGVMANGDTDLHCPNGEDKSAIKSVNRLHRIIDTLLFHGYVSITSSHQFIPDRDIPDALEQEGLKQHPEGIKTPKDRAELADTIIDVKRKWRDDAERFAERRSITTFKRRKLNGMATVSRPAESDESGSEDEDDDGPRARLQVRSKLSSL